MELTPQEIEKIVHEWYNQRVKLYADLVLAGIEAYKKKLTFSDDKLKGIIARSICDSEELIFPCELCEQNAEKAFTAISPYLSQLKEQTKTEEREKIANYLQAKSVNLKYGTREIYPLEIDNIRNGQTPNNQEKQDE